MKHWALARFLKHERLPLLALAGAGLDLEDCGTGADEMSELGARVSTCQITGAMKPMTVRKRTHCFRLAILTL